MKTFLLVCLILFLNVDLIPSKFVCRFIDKSQESIELSCDDRDFHWEDDNNCTSIIFDDDFKDNRVNVRSMKIDSCHWGFLDNGKQIVEHFENIEKIDVFNTNISYDISGLNYIWKFEHLKFLNASNNELREVPTIWRNNIINLITMNLSHNRISNVPDDTFSLAKELQIVDLSYNEITNISPFFFKNCPKLKILRLEHNQITEFGVEYWVCIFPFF